MKRERKKNYNRLALYFLMLYIGIGILLCGFSRASDDKVLPVKLVIGNCDVEEYKHEDSFEFELSADCDNRGYYCLDNTDGNEVIFSFSNIDSAMTWYVTINDENGSETYSGGDSSDASIVVTSKPNSTVELEYELGVKWEPITVDHLYGRIDVYVKE